jgi:hypothetical protein
MQAGILSARDKIHKEETIGTAKLAIWRIALAAWGIQCAFRAANGGGGEEWAVRAKGVLKVMGVPGQEVRGGPKGGAKIKEVFNIYQVDSEGYTSREALIDQYICRLLLDRAFLRFLPRFSSLLSLYASKHLLPTLSPTMSTLSAHSTSLFYEQHSKFLAIYGLYLNWTLILPEEHSSQDMEVAKRVSKKEWAKGVKELPKF